MRRILAAGLLAVLVLSCGSTGGSPAGAPGAPNAAPTVAPTPSGGAGPGEDKDYGY